MSEVGCLLGGSFESYGRPSLQYFRHLLAFLFAIEEINSRKDILPNITLGYTVFASCTSDRSALLSLLSIISGRTSIAPNYSCYQSGKLAGIVGHRLSSLSISMDSISGIYRYPQSFMHDIFREYLDKFLIVYLDDILVFSDDWESHVKQVRMVFQVLRANSLFVKGSKCLFGVQKVSFLGFIFSPSTIEMDPVKVQAIYDWTQPTSVKSLQKFLGFANFYRRFISNFSSVAKLLTDLTKKGADVVEVDASEIGAGAVLSQRSSDGSVMKPCAFFSRKFSPAERNYDVVNRELLAMKWAFEEWRHWLEGAKHRVVVLTDHKKFDLSRVCQT
ncbi:unnamed protein product, partial [Ranitomeya imitator]